MPDEDEWLFDVTEFAVARDGPDEPKVKSPQFPVWTENKARLIELYLRYFVYITKHGTYLDGFAGPQEPDQPETWAAKLVLESEPRWLRHFHLFDADPKQARSLLALREEQPNVDARGRKIVRDIAVYSGDFNGNLGSVLDGGSIGEDEATFCLLDQRTFECHWGTVRRLAEYKKKGNKIEIFYFLAVGWLHRAMSAQLDEGPVRDWWGGEDWASLKAMTQDKIRDTFVRRFKEELGYASVKAWPIFEKKSGGRVMYHMIHATDHPEAPTLMARAYHAAVLPRERKDQLELALDEVLEFDASDNTVP